MKENIKWFEENKIDFLDRARKIITVGTPSVGCDLNQLIRDNDTRMTAVSWFLYYYMLLEANIRSYKNFSKPSNYDAETLETIKESFINNKKQFNAAWENILNLDLR